MGPLAISTFLLCQELRKLLKQLPPHLKVAQLNKQSPRTPKPQPRFSHADLVAGEDVDIEDLEEILFTTLQSKPSSRGSKDLSKNSLLSPTHQDHMTMPFLCAPSSGIMHEPQHC